MSGSVAFGLDAGDERVVARIRAGDATAFDALVARHRPAMVAQARRVLGSHSDAAEDVVQEALLRAYRALGRDEREIALRPWLLTLSRNCALDELRRIRSYPLPAHDVEEQAGRAEAPDRIVSRRAELRQIVEDVATLPDEQRHALVRRAVDGAAHADIAAELGVTARASRMLVVRARADLLKLEDARGERCEAVRADLLRAHTAKRRASAHAHRHLLGCGDCRRYRHRLKALRSALHLLGPGPLLALAALGVKAGGVKLSLGASGGVTKAGLGGGFAATLSSAAVGGTMLFSAGDPSPVDVRSRALGSVVVRAGEPLPAGTAVVTRRVELGRGVTTTRLACPPRHVVADLLPPASGLLDAAYARSTTPGRSAMATVRVRSRGAPAAGLAVLCRRPVRGSIVPGGAAQASAAGAAAVCTRSVQLRARPGGRIRASGRLGQPVAVLRRSSGWTLVRTDLGQRGWVARGSVCG